jgi:hypothetical protein
MLHINYVKELKLESSLESSETIYTFIAAEEEERVKREAIVSTKKKKRKVKERYQPHDLPETALYSHLGLENQK